MRQFFYVESHSLLIVNIDWLVDAFKCLITDERFITTCTDPELITFWNGYKIDAQLDREYVEKLFKSRGKDKIIYDSDTTGALLEVCVILIIVQKI